MRSQPASTRANSNHPYAASRHGTAQSQTSRASDKSTASPTRNKRSVANIGTSALWLCNGSNTPSVSSAWDNTRRERETSGEGWGSAGETLTYWRLKHRAREGQPFGGRAQEPLTFALAALALRVDQGSELPSIISCCNRKRLRSGVEAASGAQAEPPRRQGVEGVQLNRRGDAESAGLPDGNNRQGWFACRDLHFPHLLSAIAEVARKRGKRRVARWGRTHGRP